jgi:hypothetical protein
MEACELRLKRGGSGWDCIVGGNDPMDLLFPFLFRCRKFDQALEGANMIDWQAWKKSNAQ